MTNAVLQTTAVDGHTVAALDRAGIQPWLGQLGEWLLPGHFYGVQHTWPQLYRSDGDGRFFGVFAGDRLVSHCAFRVVTVHGLHGPFRAALLGSVATDPERRGQGLASRALAAALGECDASVLHVLLWAERPKLYARHGFAAGAEETCLVLARLPRPDLTGVRLAEVRDHAALHALHEAKPWRVARTVHTMSGLLTTPGMQTVVRERDGSIVAYACCGKGADLQGHWHELGGPDDELATLLPAAMHVLGQVEAVLLLPPYRPDLPAQLGRSVVGEGSLPGPMVRSVDGRVPACWIDGLDSV
jgi:predicted N-acetyltransferase YhbS